MSRPLIGFVVLVVAALALGGGYLAYERWQETATRDQALEQLLRLRLPDPKGVSRSIGEWQDKVRVVNFWATWCAPCREEIPALMRVRSRHAPHLEVIGIAVDTAANVQPFAVELAISYPLVIGGLEVIDLSRRLGNGAGALPYTLVLDRRGKLVFAHLGGMTEAALEETVRPLLAPRISRSGIPGKFSQLVDKMAASAAN